MNILARETLTGPADRVRQLIEARQTSGVLASIDSLTRDPAGTVRAVLIVRTTGPANGPQEHPGATADPILTYAIGSPLRAVYRRHRRYILPAAILAATAVIGGAVWLVLVIVAWVTANIAVIVTVLVLAIILIGGIASGRGGQHV